MTKCMIANWKMNMTAGEVAAFMEAVKMRLASSRAEDRRYVICAPFVYLERVAAALEGMDEGHIAPGAQDCSAHTGGAHTGDISAAMLRDTGARYVILGHSERRTNHGETDALISQKAGLAHENGLTAVICVGETDAQREEGRAQHIVAQQVQHSVPDSATARNTIIAYEPVWAIGTGKTAAPEDAASMHAVIKGALISRFDDGADIAILYGGSMKPENAGDLLAQPGVDGGLVGGASLNVDSFLQL